MSVSGSTPSSRRLRNGALAGFLATAPMSVSMLMGWLMLPRREQYHLPPREITQEISERLGMEHQMTEQRLIVATVVSHFGYGALFGALYALFEKHLPLLPSLKGILAGLAIWVGSYLGWLPAFDVLQPATKHPWRRNLLMILAHVVWGASLGMVTQRLNSRN